MGILGFEIPQPHGIIGGAREKSVIARTERYVGHGTGVTLEVAYIAVVMGREVAKCVINLGAGVDDALGMMGEASKVAAVLLRQQLFLMGAIAR